MISTIIKYKYHFFLILIGLSILTLVNGLLQLDIQNIIYPDSEGYYEAAKNVYIYNIGHNYRPIVMAAINGIPYLFGCSDAFIYEFSFYVNLFCWLATALVLFEILKSFLSEKTAFFFALCSFLFVGSVVFIYHLLSENIYTLFIVLVFYFLLKYYKTKSFWTLSIALSILILSMLVRPGSKWLAVLFLLFYSKELLKFYKTKAALLIYGCLLLVVIQCAGIKYQFGNFTISYIDSVTYYNYLGSKAIAFKEGLDFKDVKNQRGAFIYSLSGPKIKENAFKDLLTQLKDNKTNFFKAYFLNLYENTTTGNAVVLDIENSCKKDNFETKKQLFFLTSKWQNIIFTLIGITVGLYFFFKKGNEYVFFKTVVFFVLYTILVSGISSEQGDRFHLVIFPFVLILLGKLLFEKQE